MAPIPIMINGLPGNVASVIARHLAGDFHVHLLPHSLTGPEIDADQTEIGDLPVELIHPDQREARMAALIRQYGRFISVDYTHPTAVNANAAFYCRHHLPFVMGTTGGDREALVREVAASDTCAVIAPNMAKQIVGFQAMMDYAASTFPGLFSGYTLSVEESHQAGKADTSGTARAVVKSFNGMGVVFSPEDIVKERDPVIQREKWGIPDAYLSGHGWHTYRLTSPDKTVVFEFRHNVNGRDIYAGGTLDAICFLKKQVDAGEKGKVFTMIDVLKG
ncbi:dihydrodipicolinate reductase [Desulfosarcina sp. OttesenSCG-928-A07]|nr:dihydrodipicolinate reductase [Desulfosarcina sp. OttesenSCG-928-G17]MDL2329244.1 dihydrodipicolinate reductase [Desulfosarcina sp. OttesenSCG-928-A07]